MPAEHFTRTDVIGVTLGTAIFAFVLIPPGYLIAWICDLFGFRKQTLGWQLVLALPLSIGAVPVLTFLAWSYAGIGTVWILYGVAALFFLCRFSRARRRSIAWWVAAAMAIWFLIVCSSGGDLQFGDRLYVSIISADFSLRTALIDGIARWGVPARNPLFYPAHPVALRYHYFWLMLCALVDIAAGRSVDARQALIASDVWCGWGVMAVLALYLRFFHPAGERGINRRVKFAIALLAVGGMDILPIILFDELSFLTKRIALIYPGVEWWNEDSVSSFVDATLWVAHHMSAAIACLAGFLVLSMGTRRARHPWIAAVYAGICFASSAGLSIYVTFAFGIFLLVWGIFILLRRDGRERAYWLVAGAATMVGAVPFLRSLGEAGGAGGAFVAFGFRRFQPVDLALQVLDVRTSYIRLADLAALPLNYFLEGGVWFVVTAIWLRRAWRRRRHLAESEQAALTMFVVILFVATFLRSTVIQNNDLGWRSMLLLQIILLIWSTDPLRAWWRARRSRLFMTPWRARIGILVALGIASTVYDLGSLRFFLPLVDHGWIPRVWHYADSGRRNYDARQVYTQLRELTAADAVYQANPTHFDDILHGMYAMRQEASYDSGCGSGMGGEGDCRAMQAQLAPLFTNPAAARTSDIDNVCRAWGINVLIAKSDDPVFSDRETWPWQRPPIAANENVRAIPCGDRLER